MHIAHTTAVFVEPNGHREKGGKRTLKNLIDESTKWDHRNISIYYLKLKPVDR